MGSLEDVSEQPIEVEKSASDDREYRFFVLENEMKVLVIHDQDTDKAAAAMNVNIGSLADPKHLPGLAHFCEHMLFLGTEKFPKENEYSSFISEHAGFSNAFTASSDTNYYFDIAQEHLEGALDRFCEFFYSPLFNQDCTEREVNAVDSENDKNLQNDSWRLHQLEKATSDPSHPFHKFSTGDKSTLEEIPKQTGVDVRSALLEFHDKYYSSHLMSLAVLGNQSLDDLEAMVRARFSNVERKNTNPPAINGHPHTEDYLQQYIEVVPVKELRSLTLCFPIEDQTLNYTTQPGHYLAHLLGHEGPGSLLSLLKQQGWANGLCAGDYQGEIGVFGFFKIIIDLSEEGETHITEILEAVFQYIALLKHEGVKEWIFEECRDLYSAAFTFKDKSRPASYCSRLAKDIRVYPANHILSAPFKLNTFAPDLVESILDNLKPELLRVTVVSKKFETKANLETEKWYGTLYHKRRLSQEEIHRWKNVTLSPDLKLPTPNNFIATKFDIKPPPPNVSKYPELIRDSPLSKIWHKQDDKFLLPKATILFALTSPVAYSDARSCNLTRLFSDMLKDDLTEFAYNAELAGISYSTDNTMYGIDFAVNGYDEKLTIFLEALVERMVSLKVSKDRFPLIKDRYRRSLANFESGQPSSLASYGFKILVQERTYTHGERLAALDEITHEDVQNFYPKLLRRVHLECLVHGNITREETITFADDLESLFKNRMHTTSLLEVELQPQRQYVLRPSEEVRLEVKTNVHHVYCTFMYFQVGLDNPRNNVLLMLLAQIIKEPFFHTLRTQEQLGYIVHAGVQKLYGVRGMVFVVQSEKHTSILDSRIESFIAAFETNIVEMSEEQFQKHVESLSTMLLESPKALSLEAKRHWSEITGKTYTFRRHSRDAETLRTLSKSDVLEFLQTYLLNKSTRRKAAVWCKPSQGALQRRASNSRKNSSVNLSIPPKTSNTNDEDRENDSKVVELEVNDILRFQKKLFLHGLPQATHHDLVK